MYLTWLLVFKEIRLEDTKGAVDITYINNIFFLRFTIKDTILKNINKWLKFKKYRYETFNLFWLRIIWRGKAFRVRLFKKQKKFTLNFGYSHWTKLKYNTQSIKVNKIHRQNYIVIYRFFWQTIKLIKLLNNIKTINKYTKRGIRVKKTPYIRRFGKISQVVSRLHDFS